MLISVFRIIKLLIVLPIAIYDMCAAVVKLYDKKYVYVYHHGWGVGHTVHDTVHFRKRHIKNTVTSIFFNDGKHNQLLSNAFDGISVCFISIYITIPIINKRIVLDKIKSFMIYNIFYKIICYFYKAKQIMRIEDYREKFSNSLNLSKIPLGYFIAYGTDYKSGCGIYISDDIVQRIENKIMDTHDMIFSDYINKCVCFYLREKGNDPNVVNESSRNSSPWSDYTKIFSYLSKEKYLILLYGEYDYDLVIDDVAKYNIVCAESIMEKRDSFSLYAAIKCDFFIGSAGGGLSFPLARSILPKILVLNVLPYNIAYPYSTVVYKNARKKNGCLVPSSDLLSKFSYFYEIDGCVMEYNDSDLIYFTTLEFIEYSGLSRSSDDISYPAWIDQDSDLIKMHTRLSPVWLSSNMI